MHLVMHFHALQSAAPLQTPYDATLEELEFETPAIETGKPRDLLTTEDMAAADAVSYEQSSRWFRCMALCAFSSAFSAAFSSATRY